VKRADEAAFLAAVRRDGFPDFNIRKLTRHAGDRLIIPYIEPQADNLPTIGLDIVSGPFRQQAATPQYVKITPFLRVVRKNNEYCK